MFRGNYIIIKEYLITQFGLLMMEMSYILAYSPREISIIRDEIFLYKTNNYNFNKFHNSYITIIIRK